MPLQNRVTPEGEIIATPHRGLMMGNRGGAFHLPDQVLGARRWASKQWIACVLEFKGRHRAAMMQPNRYTELFFLDEVTALAAGHRPCAECRRADFLRFRAAWVAGNPGHGFESRVRIGEIDRVLHAERVERGGRKQTWSSPLTDLPDGVLLVREGAPDAPLLRWRAAFRPWSSAGYGAPVTMPDRETVAVLTPASTVRAIRAGYVPTVHSSADAGTA